MLTPRQVSRLAGVSPGLVRYMIRIGKLPACKVKTNCHPGYAYEISELDTERFCRTPRPMGRPRLNK